MVEYVFSPRRAGTLSVIRNCEPVDTFVERQRRLNVFVALYLDEQLSSFSSSDIIMKRWRLRMTGVIRKTPPSPCTAANKSPHPHLLRRLALLNLLLRFQRMLPFPSLIILIRLYSRIEIPLRLLKIQERDVVSEIGRDTLLAHILSALPNTRYHDYACSGGGTGDLLHNLTPHHPPPNLLLPRLFFFSFKRSRRERDPAFIVLARD